MARYNKILLGPVTTTLPQVKELPAADDAIVPGNVIVASGGTFANATAATEGKVYVAQDNYLAMKGVDDAYNAGNVALGLEPLDGLIFAVRLAAGETATADAPLTPAADGTLAVAGASDMILFFAEEAYDNAAGASAVLIKVRPAKGYLTASA